MLRKTVITAVSDTSAATLPTLFNVFLRLLPDLQLPSRGSQKDAAFRKDIGLEDPKDAEFVAEHLGKLVLFRLNNTPLAKLPGLTEDDIRFLTLGKPETWNPPSGLSP
ncbi:hypothetical protein B0T24DRAFT_712291 [Lasiosphaeria ovina]|uniref:Proteasome component Ecm29 N-terminal domain-containing protein n=1 Tax=Lasiosphaeria ovina TaxID=92902 RepID=A0AAE0JUY5_9PEZI|nr:hypothetical protein B0T24DRAFT_712291 [Lasiosphaeria ovina]